MTARQPAMQRSAVSENKASDLACFILVQFRNTDETSRMSQTFGYFNFPRKILGNEFVLFEGPQAKRAHVLPRHCSPLATFPTTRTRHFGYGHCSSFASRLFTRRRAAAG